MKKPIKLSTRFIAFAMAISMLFILPAQASTDDGGILTGDYVLNGSSQLWVEGNETVELTGNDTLVILNAPDGAKKINVSSPANSNVTIRGIAENCTDMYIAVENDINLTIEDLNITAPENQAAIRLSKTDDSDTTAMTINVSGTCNLFGNGYGEGIASNIGQTLVITGNGVLNVTGGNTTDTNARSAIGVAGFYDGTVANLIIDGNVTINATGGNSASGIGGDGIIVEFGNLLIKGGTVTAKGGVSNSSNSLVSRGISATFSGSTPISGDGNITIEGGSVTAIGADADNSSGSNGICALSNLNITGGNVRAFGGNSVNTNGSPAIYAYKGDFNITGGIVEATGGNSVSASGGPAVYVYEKDTNISGGTVKAIGGNGAVNGSHGIFAYMGRVTIKSGSDFTAIGGNGNTGVGGVGIRATGFSSSTNTLLGNTVVISEDAGDVFVRGGQGAPGQRASIMGKDVYISTGNIGAVLMEVTDSPRSIKNKPDGDDIYMLSVTTDPAAAVVIHSEVNGALGGSYTYNATTKADGMAYMWLPADTQSVSATGYDNESVSVTTDDSADVILYGAGPAAPTNPVQDDVHNTFGWTFVPGITSISDYQYSLDGGDTWNDATANPQTIPNQAYAAGMVQVRVKADAGTGRKAGEVLVSIADYTEGDMGVHLIHSGTTTDFSTIQAAVNAAVDGDIINLDAGTFREQVTITKNITLQGAGIDATIIEAPDKEQLVQSGGNWTDLKARDLFAIVGVKTSTDGNVTIKDITVDGRDQGYLPLEHINPTKVRDNSYDFQGISILSSNAIIDSVKVTRVRELANDYGDTIPSGYTPADQPAGMNHNDSIFAESAQSGGNHTVVIKNSIITKFQKTAVLVWGPTLKAQIDNNTIQGYGKTLYSTGNGIQVGSSNYTAQGGGDRRGTSADITNNRILDIGLVIPSPSDNPTYEWTLDVSNTLIYYAGEVKVIGNTFTGPGIPSWKSSTTSYYDEDTGKNGYGSTGLGINGTANVVVQNNSFTGFDNALIESDGHPSSYITVSGNTFTNNVIDIWTSKGDDKITLGSSPEIIGYNTNDNGTDIITGFGAGDRLRVIGFAQNSVNGEVDGVPVVNFNGGTVTTGDSINVPAHSMQVSVSGDTTTLYVDTDGTSDEAELQIILNGIYLTENFVLEGGYIKCVPTAPHAAPQVTADDRTNKIIGANGNMEYSTDNGQNWTNYNPSNEPVFTGNQTVLVRFKAVGINPSGLITTLNFTTNPATPETPVIVPAPNSGNTAGYVEVLVNGKVENAGISTTTKVGNKTVTTVTVDAQKLEQKLESEGKNTIVTVPINTKSDIAVCELSGQMVKNMESKAAVVEVKTDSASYTLPAQQIDIDSLAELLSKNDELKDIKVQIEIAKAPAETAKVLENSAKEGNFNIVAPPIDFTVRCMNENRSVEVSEFDVFVERAILIPEGIDPGKITTGIVMDLDGNVRHVPTKVEVIDGRYYAKINSLTNSTYSVVWHPLEFKDAANHWAKEAINDMGSRMVISGVGNNSFQPDKDITRAEFAAIIVKALGLKPGIGKETFTDVKDSDWFSGYIKTACNYKLISGYNADRFGPNDKITREQAMVIIEKAMKLTPLKIELADGEVQKLLGAFSDGDKTEAYAKNGIAVCLKAGVVKGKLGKRLAPKENITRAEVAVIVKNLLQKADLI